MFAVIFYNHEGKPQTVYSSDGIDGTYAIYPDVRKAQAKANEWNGREGQDPYPYNVVPAPVLYDIEEIVLPKYTVTVKS